MALTFPARRRVTRRRPLFIFRVWLEQDEDSKHFVAHCLETGAVATADDVDTAMSIIEEVLESEAALAIDSDDLTNLYASPAPLDVWFKWNAMAEQYAPKERFFEIKSRKKPSLEQEGPAIPKKPAVSSKIEMASSKRKFA